MALTKILTAATADGAGSEFEHAGGHAVLVVTGTTASAVITLQMSPDDGTTWVTSNIAKSDALGVATGILPPCKVRALVASSTGSTSVSAWLGSVPTS